jgi:hypothetical protein
VGVRRRCWGGVRDWLLGLGSDVKEWGMMRY